MAKGWEVDPGPLHGGSSRSPSASPIAVRLTSEGSRQVSSNVESPKQTLEAS